MNKKKRSDKILPEPIGQNKFQFWFDAPVAGSPQTINQGPAGTGALPTITPVTVPVADSGNSNAVVAAAAETAPVGESLATRAETVAKVAPEKNAMKGSKAMERSSDRPPTVPPAKPAMTGSAGDDHHRSRAAEAMARSRAKLARHRPHRVEAYLDGKTRQRLSDYAAAKGLSNRHALEQFLKDRLPRPVKN